MYCAIPAGDTFRHGNLPTSRSSRYQHATRGGACATQRLPGAGHGGRTTGGLRAIASGVDDSLTNFDVLPIGIELFGDDHGQRRFDALADLGVGSEQDDSARRNVQIPVRHKVAGRFSRTRIDDQPFRGKSER